jgi:drug/metabolite transporter (DMT)-like permease
MLVSLKDWGSGKSDSAAGDMLGLTSACCYGVYTTLLKRWVDDDSRIDMLLFLGLLGVFNTLLAWPGILVLDRLKLEPFDWPSWSVLGFLVLNGILSVLSDYLWARSILITSPLVATIGAKRHSEDYLSCSLHSLLDPCCRISITFPGLTLTVPLAMVFDFLFNGVEFTWFYLGGSVLVLLGFAFVNMSFTSPAAGDEPHNRASGTVVSSGSGSLSSLSSVAAEADYADAAERLALDSDDMEGGDRLAPGAESFRTRRSERYSVSYANISVNDGDYVEEL